MAFKVWAKGATSSIARPGSERWLRASSNSLPTCRAVSSETKPTPNKACGEKAPRPDARRGANDAEPDFGENQALVSPGPRAHYGTEGIIYNHRAKLRKPSRALAIVDWVSLWLTILNSRGGG